MKISKLFHWLYASVMFLPLLAIPVFMIYAHRHTLTERTNVEINYKYETNEVNSVDDLIEGNVYSFNLSSDTIGENEFFDFDCRILSGNINFLNCDFDVFEEGSYVNSDFTFNLYFEGEYSAFSISNGYQGIVISFTGEWFETDNLIIQFISLREISEGASVNYFSSTTYNEIESVNADTTNENVMNVFFKDFGEFTDKYFNFDNVLSLHSITEWIDTNVFNGVTPLGFTIVWRYLEYWLIVSIFWLCFDVLIYVPQIAHRWLDKASLE